MPLQVSVSAVGSTRLDFEARGLEAVVRASVAYYNTEEDLDALVAALERLVQQQQQVAQEQARTGPSKHEVSAGCQGPGVSSRPGAVDEVAGSSEAVGAVAGLGTPQLRHERRGLQHV